MKNTVLVTFLPLTFPLSHQVPSANLTSPPYCKAEKPQLCHVLGANHLTLLKLNFIICKVSTTAEMVVVVPRINVSACSTRIGAWEVAAVTLLSRAVGFFIILFGYSEVNSSEDSCHRKDSLIHRGRGRKGKP